MKDTKKITVIKGHKIAINILSEFDNEIFNLNPIIALSIINTDNSPIIKYPIKYPILDFYVWIYVCNFF
mgnify:CR=1 FL=1